jgi:hypothetical protein
MIGRTTDPLEDAAESYGSQIRRELARYGTQTHSELLTKTDWSWEDIFSAESELLRVLPDKELRRRAWIVYERFTDVVGAEKAARHATLKVDDCDLDSLRADLLQIQAETARQYTIGFQVERERGLLTLFIVRVAMIAFGVLVAILAWSFLNDWIHATILTAGGIVAAAYVSQRYLAWRKRSARRPISPASLALLLLCMLAAGFTAAAPADPPASAPTTTSASTPTKTSTSTPTTSSTSAANTSPKPATSRPADTSSGPEPIDSVPDILLFPLVAVAGMLGATFSILQRAQGSGIGEPLTSLFNLRAARRQSYLSITSGAIAALVLFAVFSGGMIEGGLFPKFVNHAASTTSGFPMKLFVFLTQSGPQTNLDHGKLLVWAFIGGFAERFVPDMLDKFTASAKK